MIFVVIHSVGNLALCVRPVHSAPAGCCELMPVWLVLLFRRVIGPPAEETEGKALPDSVKKIAGGTGKPAVDPRSRV